MPLRLAFALLVAMLLNKKHKCLGLYRTIYYIPSIIGGSIAVSIVWRQIFGNQGVVMSLLSVFGINQKASFLGNPHTALGVIILMGVWQFGSSMLIFLAALKQIPGSLYESAMVDGAKQWTMYCLGKFLEDYTSNAYTNHILQSYFTDCKRIPCIHGELRNHRWWSFGQYIIICIISVQKSIYIL